MNLFDNKLNKNVPYNEVKELLQRVNHLYSASKNEQFSKEDLDFLTRYLCKSNWQCKYAFWKQKRKNGLYLLFIIDHFPDRGRKCAMDHSIEVVGTRVLSDLEHREVCANLGCVNRVMQSWHYKTPEDLVKEDLKYGVITPKNILDKFNFNRYKWDL